MGVAGVDEVKIVQLRMQFSQKMQQFITQLRNPPKGFVREFPMRSRYSAFTTIACQLDFNYYYTEA